MQEDNQTNNHNKNIYNNNNNNNYGRQRQLQENSFPALQSQSQSQPVRVFSPSNKVVRLSDPYHLQRRAAALVQSRLTHVLQDTPVAEFAKDILTTPCIFSEASYFHADLPASPSVHDSLRSSLKELKLHERASFVDFVLRMSTYQTWANQNLVFQTASEWTGTVLSFNMDIASALSFFPMATTFIILGQVPIGDTQYAFWHANDMNHISCAVNKFISELAAKGYSMPDPLRPDPLLESHDLFGAFPLLLSLLTLSGKAVVSSATTVWPAGSAIEALHLVFKSFVPASNGETQPGDRFHAPFRRNKPRVEKFKVVYVNVHDVLKNEEAMLNFFQQHASNLALFLCNSHYVLSAYPKLNKLKELWLEKASVIIQDDSGYLFAELQQASLLKLSLLGSYVGPAYVPLMNAKLTTLVVQHDLLVSFAQANQTSKTVPPLPLSYQSRWNIRSQGLIRDERPENGKCLIVGVR
eukprot:m.194125 g.194125  ORF g.194125 m.194125 type:complete len:468 (+) comp25789_c3_seq17:731-2134(+)